MEEDMALLDRSQWYDIARNTNWTPRYVKEDELFPNVMTGALGVERPKWEAYDEPYKTSYPEYVKIQRDKDAGVYSVKAALERTKLFEQADAGWLSTIKAHYGAIALGEYAAMSAEARMTRFGPAPGMRNMATFGMLDENRHAQLQLYFPHEHCSKDRQFDWAHKAYHSNEWAAIAARHTFDDLFLGRDAVSIAIMLTFAFETGFTNMQFLGLSADAAEVGDYTFSSLISSIQTDEARHAQIGGPALEILVANGQKEEAQKRVYVGIARALRLFAVLTGPAMDYYTPLSHRKQSFKEFMQEWIVVQFERSLIDLGLDLPWYWDTMIAELEFQHHAYHLGVWFWRPTVWWNPAAGMTPDDRDWLEEKYPGWNDTFGKCWDVIIDNVLKGNIAATMPETLPIVCNMSQLPICAVPGNGWNVKDYPLEYNGRSYHFNSEIDRWVFQQEPLRYRDHMSLVDRFLAGQIQPANLEGALKYMNLAPGESGDDAHNYAWAEAYRNKVYSRKAA
ncbi:Toluene-4-monooxygenase system, hydroxylase component subunit alpha [Georgfuchsia toluolica]|uniref:Toluene-4-monooxygenase system, hydroxylase component subunit alpha n=2 Tax=Georgfuchsia toluolica TaxID=424218 RepID=A0A916JAM8_9PROT|nr:Toluene-4-monooxygenase system, hydroxylase component subunit alpha [Georgfuchsia toluolica]